MKAFRNCGPNPHDTHSVAGRFRFLAVRHAGAMTLWTTAFLTSSLSPWSTPLHPSGSSAVRALASSSFSFLSVCSRWSSISSSTSTVPASTTIWCVVSANKNQGTRQTVLPSNSVDGLRAINSFSFLRKQSNHHLVGTNSATVVTPTSSLISLTTLAVDKKARREEGGRFSHQRSVALGEVHHRKRDFWRRSSLILS